MSPELQAPAQAEIQCATGCPPSHRRARRFLMSVVFLLVLLIIACTLYLALSGGFNP